jgi:hypothetical protein
MTGTWGRDLGERLHYIGFADPNVHCGRSGSTARPTLACWGTMAWSGRSSPIECYTGPL